MASTNCRMSTPMGRLALSFKNTRALVSIPALRYMSLAVAGRLALPLTGGWYCCTLQHEQLRTESGWAACELWLKIPYQQDHLDCFFNTSRYFYMNHTMYHVGEIETSRHVPAKHTWRRGNHVLNCRASIGGHIGLAAPNIVVVASRCWKPQGIVFCLDFFELIVFWVQTEAAAGPAVCFMRTICFPRLYHVT